MPEQASARASAPAERAPLEASALVGASASSTPHVTGPLEAPSAWGPGSIQEPWAWVPVRELALLQRLLAQESRPRALRPQGRQRLVRVPARGPERAQGRPSASAWEWASAFQRRARAPARARLRGSGLHARPCAEDDQLGAQRCLRSDSSPRCQEHRKDRGSPDWTSPFLLRAHRHGLLLARMTHPWVRRTGSNTKLDALSDNAGTRRDDASADSRGVLRQPGVTCVARQRLPAVGKPATKRSMASRGTPRRNARSNARESTAFFRHEAVVSRHNHAPRPLAPTAGAVPSITRASP